MAAPTVESLGFPVDTAVCFSDKKSRYDKRMEKRQLTWLGKAAPLLRTVLHPGEKVLLAVPACSPASVLEQLTTGWVIYYIKRCMLVITDRRILELAVRRDLSPRPSLREIEHAGVAQAKVSSFLSRSLKLRYQDQRTDVFTQLDSSVYAKLGAVLPALVAAGGPVASPGRHHLCPRCAGRLRAAERCPSCFLEFKTRSQALKYSLLFPGGGYFYTGHPVMGVMDALAEVMLLGLVVVSLVDLAKGQPGSMEALITFGFVLAIEKALSVYHAQHYIADYLPVDDTFTPVKAA